MTGIFQDAHEGVCHLRDGVISFMMIDYSGDEVLVRYESGWKCRYRPDGTRIAAGVILMENGEAEVLYDRQPCPRDILKFEPMGWKEAKQKYPSVQDGLCP